MDWKELTQVTAGSPFTVERVRLKASGIAIEGAFDPPLLAQLPAEDQVFIAAFVCQHGSIKEMERLFGVSYPTIKARLNRLAEQLGPAVSIQDAPSSGASESAARRGLLDRLEKGEINVDQALEELSR